MVSQYCYCYNFSVIFCRFAAIFLPQCSNIHIECSVVRLKYPTDQNLPEVTIYKCILTINHASRLAYLSVSHSIDEFMDTSKPQKNVINKLPQNSILGNVTSINLIPQCNNISGILANTIKLPEY